ncbi:MAG: hypothetical protein IPG67_11240 [Acidobacteria bacterium]|nr:hypothetical protein [Acidobacteriota bacterium]
MKQKEGIKVCVMVLYPFDTVPGQRFRIEQWEPFLIEKGIAVDYFSFADKRLIELLPQKREYSSKDISSINGSWAALTRSCKFVTV